ncbi:LON peptidase substrate-binding domain-containing protein [Vibrio ostreicida]|uniref:LON peptidase substrate-binding domain-containing protein n=1 Tax=Vibrio ostreicida TaxID=526588 RepID=A0ABT8BSU7_9VIBR|nr:LON peptidase substrate-binding domain-containing protein [Vibrio ostreicida]MDN3609202.1 LON peptidase substrate-binding domain-containing protein [Vibrio ostreicida]NPD08094.1 ATP-dependent protease [Vibrio ostreicida]
MSQLMLFPLGSILLPEGKMKLRIFEPRYKRLVKEASQRDGTFGICLFEKEGEGSSLSCVGTQAKIVDFELLDDGLLGLTVIGMKRFMIQRVKTEFDGLRVANVEWLPSWDVVDIEDRHQFIVDHLRQVYQQFPQLGEMYDQCFFDDASWVTQRWLELLPIPKSQFDFLLLQSDCSTAMEFLSQSIEP